MTSRTSQSFGTPSAGRRRSSLVWRVTLVACVVAAAGIALALVLADWLGDAMLAAGFAAAVKLA